MQKIIFFGSDQYSEIVLHILIAIPNSAISTIITTPPKPKGRDGTIEPNPVEKLANMRNLKVLYYPSNQDEMNIFEEQLEIDPNTVGLSASFPRLMPPSVIDTFAGRLYNIHPSLLPQYRNVAPVPYAIAMGDMVTGVSVFQIQSGIDNGHIYAQADAPILPTDTTPHLLHKLFSMGAELFAQFLKDPQNSLLTETVRVMRAADLIFTRKLTREAGFIEWPVLLKLIKDEPVTISETNNPLIKLRLTHHPDRTGHILSDLIRALEGYEKVWSIAETKKRRQQISLVRDTGELGFGVLIAGKPKPISWQDFEKNYL